MRYVLPRTDFSGEISVHINFHFHFEALFGHIFLPSARLHPQIQNCTGGPTHDKKYENVPKHRIFMVGPLKTCSRMFLWCFRPVFQIFQKSEVDLVFFSPLVILL